MSLESVDILSIGEPLLEFNADTDGALESAGSFGVGYGGDTSNFAVAARRAGARSGYLTRIGDDAFGNALVELWRREGVDTSGVVREAGGRTGIYFIARSPSGNAFTYYRADSPASRLTPADVPAELVAGARLLHVTGITQAISTSACDAAFHAMEVAREHDTLISYDPNHRAALWPTARSRAVVMSSIEQCDIALPNLEEGRLLTGLDDPRDVLAAFVSRGPRIVALKMGSDGVLVGDDGSVTRVPAHPAIAVDASGAGDTFDGFFVTRVLEGAAPADAARCAAVAAAHATRDHGAVRPIPYRADVDDALALAPATATPL